MAYKLRQRQSQKTIHKMAFVAGGISVLAVAAYITVVINGTQVQNSSAQINLMADQENESGQVITSFNFNDATTIEASEGLAFSSIGTGAHIVSGGVNNTNGLSAGKKSSGINMVIKANDELNGDGIDISVDFKRKEKDGNFFTRGKTFNFGMKEGRLCIKYRLLASTGKSYSIEETSQYEIPEDDQFRTYRFIYSPATGKGEILVNNASVWSNRAPENFRLAWHEKDDAVIGKDMNGENSDVAIFDNLVIRHTAKANNSPIDLLSFSADLNGKDILVTWHTRREVGTESFIVEKSSDTKHYEEVGRVTAAGFSDVLKAYSLTDHTPQMGVTYYRLALSNHRAKSVWMPVLAIRLKPDMIPSTAAPATSNATPEPVQYRQ